MAKPPPGYIPFKHGLVVPEVAAAQYGLYNTPRSTGQLDWFRQRWFTTGDIRKLVTQYDRWELMSFSRQLFAGLGNIKAAILQRNHRSVGEHFRAIYAGDDKAWGDEAEEWLEHVFYPNCDTRGEPYDFVTNLTLSGIGWDVDGDDAMVLTEDPDTHFPKLQFIPAHRINTRMSEGATSNADKKVNGGPFDGAFISNGIIYDSNRVVIGLRILGDGEEHDRDVPMTSAQLIYDPAWQSQNRGIPELAAETMGALNYQDSDVFLNRLVKRVAAVGLLRYTETGQADTGEGFIADAPLQDFSSGVKREITRGGDDYYFTAGKNEKIDVLKSNMPSDEIEAFLHRLEHRVILCLGWYPELLNPKEVGGASVRLIQDNARATVRHKQRFIKMRAKRAVRYAVAKAMKHGFISRNNSDWWKWHFEMPAVISVDHGHDATADFNMLKLGVMTEEKYQAKLGDNAKRVTKQKTAEVLRRIMAAEELAKETGKDFFWCYEQMWNPAAPQSNGPDNEKGGAGAGGSNAGGGAGGSGGGAGGDKDE